ncbi:MAG TPA: hypothetical protein VMT99_02985 [Candidatus Paceibacterota bacterium]|nr:hypothetical protein [Candidatus Paceibacterota bacterium]
MVDARFRYEVLKPKLIMGAILAGAIVLIAVISFGWPYVRKPSRQNAEKIHEPALVHRAESHPQEDQEQTPADEKGDKLADQIDDLRAQMEEKDRVIAGQNGTINDLRKTNSNLRAQVNGASSKAADGQGVRTDDKKKGETTEIAAALTRSPYGPVVTTKTDFFTLTLQAARTTESGVAFVGYLTNTSGERQFFSFEGAGGQIVDDLGNSYLLPTFMSCAIGFSSGNNQQKVNPDIRYKITGKCSIDPRARGISQMTIAVQHWPDGALPVKGGSGFFYLPEDPRKEKIMFQ